MSRDGVGKAATTDQERAEQEKREREHVDQETADLVAVAQTPQGRRLLWWLLQDVCGTGIPVRNPVEISDGRIETHATMLRAGAQDVGNSLALRLVDHAPEVYAEMIADGIATLHGSRFQEKRKKRIAQESMEK